MLGTVSEKSKPLHMKISSAQISTSDTVTLSFGEKLSFGVTLSDELPNA